MACQRKSHQRLVAQLGRVEGLLSVAEQVGAANAQYKARMITSMLRDDINYLYFSFLAPVVTEGDRVNSTFQAETDSNFLLSELSSHYGSLHSRVYDTAGALLAIAHVDFGGKFLAEAVRIMAFHNSIEMTSKISDLKGRCVHFFTELVSQLSKRIPTDETASNN